MTFADLALDALFFLGVAHGGPLLKKVDALGYAKANTLVLSTSSFMWVDPQATVTPMIDADLPSDGIAVTPYQRLDAIIAQLEQLAREFDETPIATWCLRAVEDLQQGKLRQAAHEAAKESRT